MNSNGDHGPLRLVIVAATERSQTLAELFGADAGFRSDLATSASHVTMQSVMADVALVDLRGLPSDSADVTELLQTQPLVPLVVLTPALDDHRLPVGATRVARLTCLVDDVSPHELLAVVRAAAHSDQSHGAGLRLTSRERDVLALVGAGMSNKQIARRLGISESTVKAHLTKAYRALAVTSRAQAADWSRGLSTPPV